MALCKITVLKRTLNEDLAGEYINLKVGPCPAFEEGEEYIVDSELGKPDDFCSWAWDDIYKVVVALSRGGNFNDEMFKDWMKDNRSMITCCTDGVRPVIFKVERLEEKKGNS